MAFPIFGGPPSLGQHLVASGLRLGAGLGGNFVRLGSGLGQQLVNLLAAVLPDACGNLFNSVHVFGLPPFLACLVWTHAYPAFMTSRMEASRDRMA